MANSLLELANKGRKGDSELAIVGGELSHVNPREKELIEDYGLLGEMMTQQYGSGTINPNTGMPEYFLNDLKEWGKARFTVPKSVKRADSKLGGFWGLADRYIKGTGTWRPSQGKWGIFGQTDKSKAADRAKAEADAREETFKGYKTKYGSENIAALQVGGGAEGAYGGAEDLEDFVSAAWGGDYADTASQDYKKYITEYDPREEVELFGQTTRAAQGTGAEMSSGLFSLMTQSANQDAQKGFAGSGNFEQDFKYKQALEAADREFDAQTENYMSGKLDLQEEYTKEFWKEMQAWNDAINA